MTKRAHDKIAAGPNEAPTTPPPRLTPAQRKALLWLPRDGRFAYGMPIGAAVALNSMRGLGLVEKYSGVPGEPFYAVDRYRLTPAGIAAREELEKRGDVS